MTDAPREPPLIERASCRYHGYYCEENVWHLCGDDRIGGTRYAVVISNTQRACPLWAQRAAPAKEAVVWDYHVILVACHQVGPHTCWVYDLDSRLPLPSPLPVYLQATFPFVSEGSRRNSSEISCRNVGPDLADAELSDAQACLPYVKDVDNGHPSTMARRCEAKTRSDPFAIPKLPAAAQPRFRVFASDDYRAHFWSDRSHMHTPDGSWRVPPPPWPPILGAEPTVRLLENALDMGSQGPTVPGRLVDIDDLPAVLLA